MLKMISEIRKELEQNETKKLAQEANDTIKDIKDTIITESDNWRKDVVGKSSSVFNNFGEKAQRRIRYASIHAEQSAILKLLRLPEGLSLLRGSTLYVTRILKDGSFANAKPCEVCMETIRAVGIRRIRYTLSNNTVGELYVHPS